MSEVVKNTLRRLYYNLEEPSAYSSSDRLYKHAKSFHPSLSRKTVDEWLQSQDAYTMHRKARRKLSSEPRVHVKHIDDQWCIDLCDMSNIEEFNSGHRCILTCIDVLSKYAWACGVKKKSGKQVADAMSKIFNSTDRSPKRIESDKGTEFYNRHFQNVLTESNIEHFSSNSRHKASVVERFNRTLKQLLYRSFTARNSYNWTGILEFALKTYNNRYHRSIKTTPSKVTRANETLIYRRLYRKQPRPGKKYTVGQLVRISKVKRTFEKGYLPNYTEEVFKISEVHRGLPNRYVLTDLMDETLTGKFVSDEITPVRKNSENLWKIDKVIRRDSRGRYFVKWRGFPTKFNSWVDDIILQ